MAKTKAKTAPVDVYEDIEKQLLENQKGGGDYWQPEVGRTKIRLIPFKSGTSNKVFVKEETHFYKDDDGKNVAVTCRGSDCPICDAVDDETISEKCKASVKFLCNAVIRGKDGEPDQLMICRLPKSVAMGSDKVTGLAEFCSKEGRNRYNLGDPMSLTKGRDFEIRRSGTGMKTRYEVVPAAKPTAVSFEGQPVDLTTKIRTPMDRPAMEKLVVGLKKGKRRHAAEDD